jgi:heme exporter protein A
VSNTAFRAQGLEKRFGAVTALRGIDLELQAGLALAVLGPNGAGKSTLLRILAGLSRPTAGHLEIDGRSRGHTTASELRSRVGFVGHSTFLYPELTARENLVFVGRMYGIANPGTRADQLLEEEGLSEVANRRAGTFSRGMAQRLSIARALVHDPSLVLLDEPFTGLDRRSADRLGARLTRLRDAGHTLVLVTHEVRQAGEIANRAVVMARGEVVHRAENEQLSAEALEPAYLNATGRLS